MEITPQQRRLPYFIADRLRAAPNNGGVSDPVTSDAFLRQQSAWCRRMAGNDLLDKPVKEALLDLARDYEERLAAIEQTASVPDFACEVELAAD